MCLYNICIKPTFESPARVVPCGVCYECLQKKRADWTFRLMSQVLHSKSAYFCTFTYADLTSKYLKKSDLQNYFKRLRHVESKIKYFAVGEYGTKTKRPHWHAIIFNAMDKNNLTDKWKGGFSQIAPANRATIHYVTGYLLKQGEYELVGMVFQKKDRENMEYKPIMMCSKGLGAEYAKDAGEYHISNETFKSIEGNHISRYLQMKIWQGMEEERLQITEKEKMEFLESLKKSGKTRLSAKAYYRLLHQHFKNKQKF